MAQKVANIKGQRFGKWTVVVDAGKRAPYNGEVMWLCKCGCGRLAYVSSSSLRRGQSKQCMQCGHDSRRKET